jgi:hypothetical protein
MTEKINLQKNEEQYFEFLNNFPPEIKNVILSEDTKILIPSICLENGVGEQDKIENIAYQVTMVLLGKISLNDLQMSIEKELQIDAGIAKKISDEINKNIFSQLSPEKASEPLTEKRGVPEEKMKPSKNDSYQEPIE